MDDSLLVNLIYKQFADDDVDKKRAWKTIAAFTGSTENICKKRWNFLRSKYERIKSGAEKDENWELFDSMSLYDKVKDIIHSDNSGESSEDDGEEEEEMEPHVPVNNLKPPSKKKPAVPRTPAAKPTPKPVAVAPTPKIPQTPVLPTATPKKRKLEKPSPQAENDERATLDASASGEAHFRQSRRVDVAFGKYMGLEMSQIHDPNNTIKPQLRKKIQQIVHEEIQKSLKH